MPGYKLFFAEPLDRHLTCPLCRLPMRQPVIVADCSHSFCDTCLDDYLSKGSIKCPIDKKPIDYAKIYPDQAAEADIMTSLVRCSRYKDGCQWIDQLQKAQAHIDTCSFYGLLPCPNECPSRMSRAEFDSHVKYLCPRRRAICSSCNKEFIGDVLEKHQGSCPMESVWCENKCGLRLQRRHLAYHIETDCHKRTVTCTHCHKQFVYETIQDHYYRCPRYPMSCPNRCESGKIAREDVDVHVAQLCPSSHVPCPFRELGCKHVGTRQTLESHHTTTSQSHLSLVCKLAVDQQRQIEDLTRRLAAVSALQAAPDGSFVWRVDGFKAKSGGEVKSGAFYTFPHGYRLRASMFPTGNGSGEGTYLSIYMRLVPGDYDPLLDWPFRSSIAVSVLDQCSDTRKRSHVVESFTPNVTWKQFQRPSQTPTGTSKEPASSTDGVANWFGYPRFMTLESLSAGSYVRDDTIFIKFKVDLPKYIER